MATKALDPHAAVVTPGGRRSLDSLVHRDPARALAAMLELLDRPHDDVKQLAFLLAWAGRIALGPLPIEKAEPRHAAHEALDARFATWARYLAHKDKQVHVAATVAIAACRANADAAQHLLHARRVETLELACSVRLASGVLARDTGCASLFERMPIEVGQPSYHADVIRRHLASEDATAGELEAARYYGERRLSKLAWFPGSFGSSLRAMIHERPLAEREAAAIALVERNDGPRALVLVFDRRTPQQTTFLRPGELTPTQRRVVAALDTANMHWTGVMHAANEVRLPSTSFGRAVLLGNATGPLAENVATARGPTPLFIALVDLLSDATHDGLTVEAHRARVDALVARTRELDTAARSSEELVDGRQRWTSLFNRAAIGPAWPPEQ